MSYHIPYGYTVQLKRLHWVPHDPPRDHQGFVFHALGKPAWYTTITPYRQTVIVIVLSKHHTNPCRIA